jgi:hypothetical protein
MVIRGTDRVRERPAALPCLSVACVVKRMRFDSEVKTGLYFGCCTVWRVDGLKIGLFQVAQLRRQAPAEGIALRLAAWLLRKLPLVKTFDAWQKPRLAPLDHQPAA